MILHVIFQVRTRRHSRDTDATANYSSPQANRAATTLPPKVGIKALAAPLVPAGAAEPEGIELLLLAF